MSKFLDYGGLERFWGHVDDIKQDKLTIDKELDATSHNPVENMAIKFEIDKLLERIDDGDDDNTFLYELYKGIIPYTGSGQYLNTYESTCYCLVHGLVATIYFDIIGNYGAQQFALTKKVPAGCTPFKGLTHLVAQSQSEFNNISIGTDGQIIITSNNGNFDTHCAITYLIKPSSLNPSNPDPTPEEEAQYTTSAILVKIGNYFPTVSGNTMGGQTMRGVALMTDVAGSQFSGYEGGYTVYMENGQNTRPGTEQFYWSKKYENYTNNEDKGYLYSFSECFEAASDPITEQDLIDKGLDVVEELAENVETIQYFVTSFGKEAWVGNINSTHNSEIKEKAYGGTSGAGDYNGRIYWEKAILAHVFRYVPASADPDNKTHPIEQGGSVIGYVDKIIPLKLIDTAYSWANFNTVNDSTWRAIKLISTQEELQSLNSIFEAQLVFEDWNNSSTTGNKFGNISNYYQRIDAKLVETQTESSSGSSVDIPTWLSNLPSYESTAANALAQKYSGTEFYNGRLDLALKAENDVCYVMCIVPPAALVDDYDPEVTYTFDPNIFSISNGYDYFMGIGLSWDPEEVSTDFSGTIGFVLLKYNGSSWVVVDEPDFDVDITQSYTDNVNMTEGHVVKITGGLIYDFSNFGGSWDIVPQQGGGVTIVTSINQDYVQVRTGKNWAKTSNRISTYTGSEFN